MQAKKQFGQHFLKSESALGKIRDAADMEGDDIVLEIGPGTGVLTDILLKFAGKVVAVEKDRDMIPLLKEKFSKEIASGKLDLINQDILDFDPATLAFYAEHDYIIVANIPYYITGAILEKFLSAQKQPSRMVLLVQKEVAERIIARDGKESILSISVKVYGTPKLVAKVPAGAFNPPPTVDSAILLIENISKDFFNNCDEGRFFQLVKFVFGKKRKQLGGSLSDFLKNKDKVVELLKNLAIDPQIRPERLTSNDWKRITQAL